jgi:hypothetical protein
VTDVPAEPQEPGHASGLIARLEARGQELARGRRLILPLPGWEDLGDGRGLWARFSPLSRDQQDRWTSSPVQAAAKDIDLLADILPDLCEEILIGTAAERTPLSDEPDVAAQVTPPLTFNADLGRVLGVGGDTPGAVMKRMLVHLGDDLPFFGVAGAVIGWSQALNQKQIEVATGE